MSHPLIGQVLTQMGKLSSIDIDEILVEQNASRRRFGEIAVGWGLCDIQELCDAWCSQAGHALAVNIDAIGVDPSALDWLSSDVAYSFSVIPQLGRLVTGDAEPYRYLVESIRMFPKPEAFAAMIRDAGFGRVTHQALSGNIAAIHSGWKL